jgi:hypothetical protein
MKEAGDSAKKAGEHALDAARSTGEAIKHDAESAAKDVKEGRRRLPKRSSKKLLKPSTASSRRIRTNDRLRTLSLWERAG